MANLMDSLARLLPLPGGIGWIDGGLIGTLSVFARPRRSRSSRPRLPRDLFWLPLTGAPSGSSR